MTNPSENIQETNQSNSQEEKKPLFSGTDSQGKERLFNNVEEAQKSWQSSQDFIKDTVTEKKSLEAKVLELEAKLNQSMKLEDALAQLQSKEESPVTETSQQQTTEQTSQVDVQQLTEQITESIMGKLTDSQKQEVETSNETESMKAAQAVYGESYEDKLRETAQGLGMSDSDIVQTAQKNPTLFKQVFGLNKQPNSSSSTFSSYTGSVADDTVKLELGKKGYSTSKMMDNHRANLEALMKKHST